MSLAFKIAIAADVIAIVVALYFMYKDYFTSYSSSSNGLLSLVTMGLMAWVGFSYYLHTHGSPKIGAIMAWIPAIPILGYGLMILAFVIFKPDMR
jgi:hypothetical protein